MSPPLTPRPLLCRVRPDRALVHGVPVGKPAAAPRQSWRARRGAGSSGSVHDLSWVLYAEADAYVHMYGLEGGALYATGRRPSNVTLLGPRCARQDGKWLGDRLQGQAECCSSVVDQMAAVLWGLPLFCPSPLCCPEHVVTGHPLGPWLRPRRGRGGQPGGRSLPLRTV